MEKNACKGKKCITWEILSRYRAQLMGIAIIWVILYHGNEYGMVLPKLDIINFFLEKGRGGVDVFLLLSGLGLYYSFSKTPDIVRFYKKRFLRVVIPYFLIATPFWIVQDLFLEPDIIAFFKNLTLVSFWSEGYTRLWYFALLIPLYLLYPLIYNLVFKEEKRSTQKTVILIVFVIIFNCIVRYEWPDYYQKIEIALTRIPVFLLGSLLGYYAKIKKEIAPGEMILLLLGYSYRMYTYEYDISGMSVRYWYITLAIVVCFASVYLIQEWRKRFGSDLRLINLAGKYSMELYIIHVWLRNLFGKANLEFVVNGIDLNKWKIMEYSLIIVTSCLLTMVFALLEKKILDRN